MQDEILYRRSAIQDSSVPDALLVPENMSAAARSGIA